MAETVRYKDGEIAKGLKILESAQDKLKNTRAEMEKAIDAIFVADQYNDLVQAGYSKENVKSAILALVDDSKQQVDNLKKGIEDKVAAIKDFQTNESSNESGFWGFLKTVGSGIFVVGEKLVAGLGTALEGVVDAGASLIGGFCSLLGFKGASDSIANFVAKDWVSEAENKLYNETDFGRGIRNRLSGSWFDVENGWVSNTVKSVGYVTGLAALSCVPGVGTGLAVAGAAGHNLQTQFQKQGDMNHSYLQAAIYATPGTILDVVSANAYKAIGAAAVQFHSAAAGASLGERALVGGSLILESAMKHKFLTAGLVGDLLMNNARNKDNAYRASTASDTTPESSDAGNNIDNPLDNNSLDYDNDNTNPLDDYNINELNQNDDTTTSNSDSTTTPTDSQKDNIIIEIDETNSDKVQEVATNEEKATNAEVADSKVIENTQQNKHIIEDPKQTPTSEGNQTVIETEEKVPTQEGSSNNSQEKEVVYVYENTPSNNGTYNYSTQPEQNISTTQADPTPVETTPTETTPIKEPKENMEGNIISSINSIPTYENQPLPVEKTEKVITKSPDIFIPTAAAFTAAAAAGIGTKGYMESRKMEKEIEEGEENTGIYSEEWNGSDEDMNADYGEEENKTLNNEDDYSYNANSIIEEYEDDENTNRYKATKNNKVEYIENYEYEN